MKKFLAALIIALNFFAVAHAEIQTYEGRGEYFMTDETPDFAKSQAELAAQRDVLERICVYVREETEMIDQELDKDEIITIAAGILYQTGVKFSMEDEADGVTVTAFVTADIDTDELKTLLEREIENRKEELR